ncbi:MAG: hypothetical protein QOH36_2038 [Actinomycetota bacterium]|nr:hypothetical protein [Actinomycetota bacterium]
MPKLEPPTSGRRPRHHGRMARVRCSGGIVLEGDYRVWLVADPGEEVLDSRQSPGAPVVVGRATATRAEVDRARRDAQRLVARGGPIVAAAGVRIRAFRTARLEGSAESRRDAVLAAVEVLGSKGLHRIGEPTAVLVALFGVRATKRVGAAALAGLALDQLSPLRLAVAASDLLGPEQLETLLALRSPPGTEPVPRGDAIVLGEQLTAVLGPYTAPRRVALLRSLWDEVVRWQLSAIARGRARRRPTSPAAIERWQRKVRRLDSAWWQARAAAAYGDAPDALALALWAPSRDVWQEALVRALHECAAATTLLRTALAAEERPVQAAVLEHLEALEYVASLGEHGAACRRAALLATTVALASDTVPSGGDRLGGRDVDQLLTAQLRDTWALAHASLAAALGLGSAMYRSSFGWAEPLSSPVVAEWRAVAGYGPGRAPDEWHFRFLGPDSVLSLATRLTTGEGVKAADVELLDDGLWIADLADALATWYGHRRAEVYGVHGIVVDPADDEDDPRTPLLESVPLAAAGAAQLLAIGAAPPSRPKTWEALVAALVAAAENLGLDEPFPMAAEVAAMDGTVLPEGDLSVEVARTPRQLAGWGNYMGNCIAGYADDANRRYALVALRDATGRLVVNLALNRGARRWFVSEAFARFNEDLPADLRARIDGWAGQIPVATSAGGGRVGTRPRRTAPGGRRPPARDRLLRASARLGDELGDLGAASDEVAAMAAALAPIARELGWTGAVTDRDWLDPFVAIARPRRPGSLAAATARVLGTGCPLAELWEATATRPLATAIERVGDIDVDLRRLTGTTVPAALRLGLRDPRVRAGRTVDLAGHRVRLALAELLTAADARLDRAVVERPHLNFVTVAVLTLTARGGLVVQPVDWVPVAGDDSLPGRPRSSVRDERGPWVEARSAAIELGVTGERLDEVVADAPGRHLLVPTAWTADGGWTGLWARAHRITRLLRS